MALVIATCIAAIAEPIRFSTPAVPIAAPPKPDTLPVARNNRPLDLAAPSAPQMMAPQAHTIIRTAPRRRDDDEENVHWLLRDPSKPKDEERGNENVDGLAKNKGREKGKDKGKENERNNPNARPYGPKNDQENALAPVTDMNWTGRSESEKTRRELVLPGADRKDTRPDLLGTGTEDEPKDPFRSGFVLDMFTARPKEKPTAFQLERRAEFQQLLNSSYVPTPEMDLITRNAGSLDPVTPEAPKVLPVMNSPLRSLNTPQNPMSAVELPGAAAGIRRSLAGVPEDPRSAGATFQNRPAANQQVSERPFSTPLMRQPTVREIPSRRF